MQVPIVFMILSGLATGAMEPPSYEEELVQRVVRSAETLNQAGRYREAIQLCKDFQRQFTWRAVLLYEQAFALNALQRDDEARRAYQRAVELEPSHAASWYDLGELELQAGRIDAAAEAFEQAALLRPDHWAGPFRLAEIAARRGDPRQFEIQLKRALAQGFSFQVVVVDPHWREYYREPALGEVMRRLVTVYGDERLLEAFESPLTGE